MNGGYRDRIVNVAVLGMGTVGGGVIEVLAEQAGLIAERAQGPVRLRKVLGRDGKKAHTLPPGVEFTTDPASVLEDQSIDIVVELIGREQPACDYLQRAMRAGKSVVTANKDVIAAHGREMVALARSNKVDLLFEASVGGGIPIIRPILQCLAANRITVIMGIVNGTTNYMLTKMTEEGLDYEEVLRQAQDKGYAESDPTADVEGMDAARKIAILASIAFGGRIELADVSIEGITNIDRHDIGYARELGYVVKLLAVARDNPEGVDVKVYPAFLPQHHPLAAVNDVFNAIFVHGQPVGDVMFYGRGAGRRPTASAVVGDIIEAARNIRQNCRGRLLSDGFGGHRATMLPDDIHSAFYVRLLVDDRPGVFAAIASVFGAHQVSMHSVIQKRKYGRCAEIVLITYSVAEKNLYAAIGELRANRSVQKIGSLVRVEDDSLRIGYGQ
ncbi:MAG: homoserine dehydrogenase [Negativicutes bacterium]|nr:homoserine dehydrogenase [Negativicutes bacterium]